MQTINLIGNIFIENGILHIYGREGVPTRVFLRQGNLEGSCAIWNNIIDVNIDYNDVDKLDFNHMANEKVLVDAILLIDDWKWLTTAFLPFESEEINSIFPFDPEGNNPILPF